jgi:cytidine deaminase
MENSELVNAAADARKNAYAPYSSFQVGAALLTKSGKIFKGCNVENMSFRLTLCAEEVAVGAAVAEGNRDFVAMAIVADSQRPVLPCGGCRQLLAEFNSNLELIGATTDGCTETHLLSDLLPRSNQGILDR